MSPIATASLLAIVFSSVIGEVAMLFPVLRVQSEDLIPKKVQRNSNRDFRLVKRENSVCYENLGCFEPGPGPLRRRLKILPKKPEEIGTTVQLFTPESPNDFEEIDWLDKNNITQSSIDSDRRSVIFIHGFGSSANQTSSIAVKNAFLKAEPVNFFLIDWEPGAGSILYHQAAANTEVVGRQVAILLANIMDALDYDPRKFHLVGFSLGAQVAGFVGHYFSNVLKPGYKIPRITGLDPAGPEFYDGDYPNNTRLDASDAEYVDVIHSNGGVLATGHLSSLTQMGHVDYYPNGGARQPGCSIAPISNIETAFTAEAREQGQCNHGRAWEYFVASLLDPSCDYMSIPCGDDDDNPNVATRRNSASFAAARKDFFSGRCFECSSSVNSVDSSSGERKACGRMGYKSIETPARGKHFLVTSKEKPFCGFMYAVTIASSAHQPYSHSGRTRGQILISVMHEDGSDRAALDPRPVFGSNATTLEAGKTKTAVVLMDRPGLKLAENLAMIARIEYSPAIISSSSSWGIDYIEIADHAGNRVAAPVFGTLQEKEPIEVMLLSTGNSPASLATFFPDLVLYSQLSDFYG